MVIKIKNAEAFSKREMIRSEGVSIEKLELWKSRGIVKSFTVYLSLEGLEELKKQVDLTYEAVKKSLS
ncbi:unnamed protein product [marine sediment metagenome]|uniref:Uncharacterized protein n=1 Tax=marine sediment metagenome TaxID=412755 RepID=X0YJM4_9ZZZZ